MMYGVTDHMKSNTAGEFVIDTPSKLKGKLEMVISSDHEKLFFSFGYTWYLELLSMSG